MRVRNEFVATDKGLIINDGRVISSPEGPERNKILRVCKVFIQFMLTISEKVTFTSMIIGNGILYNLLPFFFKY